MSEAPHLELNNSDLPDLDPSAPSNMDSYTNGNGSSNKPQLTKEHIMNSLSASRSSPTSSPLTTSAAAQSAMDSIANHPTTQNVKNTVSNGPVGQKVKAESAATRNEFADLVNSRTTPETPAATGQPLTHYHSMFYRLLSWKNPRATGIAFAASVLFIFAARYLNVLRYGLKLLCYTLGATGAAEIAGKAAFGHGFASQMRPRKYLTIPKASLERLLDDVEQFINFFVIESQRIVFAENVYATVAAFFASLVSYFLIKFVPLWGLALIATTVAYLGPLIYIQNKEVIDGHLHRASTMASEQAAQMKNLAAHHTGNAANTVKSYAGEYSSKAQETINQYRGRSASPEVKREDFPAAPAHEPAPERESAPEGVPAPAL